MPPGFFHAGREGGEVDTIGAGVDAGAGGVAGAVGALAACPHAARSEARTKIDRFMPRS
jgi:hypothetical protein